MNRDPAAFVCSEEFESMEGVTTWVMERTLRPREEFGNTTNRII